MLSPQSPAPVPGRVGASIFPVDDASAMLDFARRWLPYGGGSDGEILVGFGLSAQRFYRILAHILDTGDLVPVTGALTTIERSALRQQCLLRVSIGPRRAAGM